MHAQDFPAVLRGFNRKVMALMQMDSTLDTYDSGREEDEAEEALETPDLRMPHGLLAPPVEASDLDSNAGGAMPTPSIAGPSADLGVYLMDWPSGRACHNTGSKGGFMKWLGYIALSPDCASQVLIQTPQMHWRHQPGKRSQGG